MTLLDSLLDAIVRLEGDALVMHVGEKPYVVTTSSAMSAYRGPLAWGQVELSSRVLTPDAVMSMVGQILPADQRNALDEIGAVEHEIASPAGVVDRFSVVAARGGDDIWLELRRLPSSAADARGESVPAGLESGLAWEDAAASPVAGQTSGTAAGLQEPPLPPSDTGIEPVVSREEQMAAPASADEIAREAERPASQSGEISERPVEDRVPLVDEMRKEAVEHGRMDVGSESDPALELVEAEPQDAPTDQDVDAMLAATAASLLSANLKSDVPEAERAAQDEGLPELAQEFADSMFEVVHEDQDEEQEEDEEAEAEPAGDVDLTSALDELPAPPSEPWASAVRDQQHAEEAICPAGAGDAAAAAEPQPEEPAAAAREPEPVESPAAVAAAAGVSPEPAEASEPAAAAPEQELEEAPAAAAEADVVPVIQREARDAEPSLTSDTSERPVEHPAALPATGSQTPISGAARIAAGAHDLAHGVVVPIDRGRPERPDAGGRVDDERLQQILRAAADRGASTVYVVAQSAPMIRVDGEIGVLDAETALNAADIDRLVAALAPSRQAGMPVEPGAEWISEVPRVGRVRCVAFRDHRGPGLIFRLISAKSISAEQLNLSQEIRELCTLSDGLVLVAGARGSGKSTLLDSFVDLINRTRSEHVIAVETELAFVHESGKSFISQREVHAGGQAAAAALHSALREDPDVLVVEDVQSTEVARAVLHAAESGRLVFASINAASSAAAVDALIDLMPDAERASARTALSSVLRAVVTQLLLRKASGGRVAARELLINSSTAAASIRNSDPAGLAGALEAGQRYGMVPMNDSLAALVRAGTVHGAEAYRRAADRQGLLASLARDGVDTSFAERLA